MPRIPNNPTNPLNTNKVSIGKNLSKKEIEKLVEEFEGKFFKGRLDISYGWDKIKEPNDTKKKWVIFVYGETNESLKDLPDEYRGIKVIKEVIGKIDRE